MARIENYKYSIEEAFRECFYTVPDFQREYAWTDKEVHQLQENIGEQIDAGTTREYFIGTMLVAPTEQKMSISVQIFPVATSRPCSSWKLGSAGSIRKNW